MNIHITDTFFYYLPYLLKTEAVLPKDFDILGFFTHVKATHRPQLVNSWSESLSQKFEPHVALGLALHFALTGNEEKFSLVVRQVQLKRGPFRVTPLLQVLLLAHKNDFEAALGILKELPVDLAKIGFVTALRADVLFDMKDHGRAEQAYREALVTIEKKSPIYSRIGEICLLRKDYDSAQAALRTAIELDERNMMAHLYMGDLHQVRGDFASAKTEYGICAAVDFKSNISQLAQQKLLQLSFRK